MKADKVLSRRFFVRVLGLHRAQNTIVVKQKKKIVHSRRPSSINLVIFV